MGSGQRAIRYVCIRAIGHFDADGAEGSCVPAVPKSQRVLARTLEQTDGYVIGHGRARCRDLCAVCRMGPFSAPIPRAQGAHEEIQMTREVHPSGKDQRGMERLPRQISSISRFSDPFFPLRLLRDRASSCRRRCIRC